MLRKSEFRFYAEKQRTSSQEPIKMFYTNSRFSAVFYITHYKDKTATLAVIDWTLSFGIIASPREKFFWNLSAKKSMKSA